MSKEPYWAMMGGVAGFFLGIAMIMLVSADFSLNNLFDATRDTAALPSMQVRLLILVICMAAGMVSGIVGSLVLSKMGAEPEVPEI